jgi:UDP-N-acetylglucosamine--N-acetylmuramyl-(pentapeptide) pyrophosphoryl-undecaprenol N-acetylglucosamine transferase
MLDKENLKIIIAGGGTGGHLFPGVAIAEEFLRRHSAHDVLFVGTAQGLEGRILENMGYRLRTIDVAGIRGKSIIKTLGGLMKIPTSMVQSWSIIRDYDPDMVIGVGGYASGPAVITAHYMGKKTAIAEQNAVPGATNKILGRFADKVFVTFRETATWFSPDKAVVTGNPVRASFIKEKKETRKADRNFTILIFGGSQGASGINNAVIESLDFLEALKGDMTFVHQTGVHDCDRVTAAYRSHNMDAEVSAFINDMAAAYDAADLLLCRAGATTVAEVTASGKAAVFIPFPFAVGDHQRLNAQVLVEAGAAEMILQKDLTGETLARLIERLFHDRTRIGEMEKNSRLLGNINAAAYIVDECMTVLHNI